MNNYDYPMGADTSSAPWNQKDNPEMEIEVTVSVTLSKNFTIKVKDKSGKEYNKQKMAPATIINSIKSF